LDPLSDKILVCTVFLSLTYANLIPASLTGLIVSRDLFLVYAGLYIRYMSVVPPFSLQKYFDPTLPTATIQPTTISKVNTALQFLLIAVSLGAPLLQLQNHPYLHYLWAATGTTTFLSAVSYAFMKVKVSLSVCCFSTISHFQNTYKFSHREYDHQFGKKLTAFILFILFNIGFTLSFPSQV
jgi:phosphatidylglycerophosphate synthase